MTQALTRTEKPQASEAGTAGATTEVVQSEQTGLSKIARGQGAEPPPVQRSINQLHNLPSEQLRQKVLRSLSHKYGNQYANQVMRQYRTNQTAAKALASPVVARTLEEQLPSEAELQAEINVELSSVESVKPGDASESGGGNIAVPEIPAVAEVPEPAKAAPVPKSQAKAAAKVTVSPTQLEAKAAPPNLANTPQAAKAGAPAPFKEASKTANSQESVILQAPTVANNLQASTETVGKKAGAKTKLPHLKNGLLHKGLNQTKKLVGQPKSQLKAKLGNRSGLKNRLVSTVNRAIASTASNTLGVARRLMGNIAPVAPTSAPQIQRSPTAAPTQHPGFKKVKSQISQAAKDQKKHQPAKTKATQAQAAAQPPSNEKATMAEAGHVDTMSQQQPKGFNKAGFISALHQAIEAVTPKNQEDADDFKKSGKAGQIKNQVGQTVKQGKQDSEKDIKDKTEAAPNPSEAKGQPKPVVAMDPEKPGAAPAIPGAAAAMPDPKSESEVSLQAGKTALNQQMSQANVTEEQLQKSNEPTFHTALASKKEAEVHADTAPAEFRSGEKTVLEGAHQEANAKASKALTGMNTGRASVLAGVNTQQQTTKTGDETARAKVSQEIEARYNTTKTDATKILTDLDGKVNDLFDKGEKVARTAFENYVDQRMSAYKEKRYSGWTGGIQWGIDKLLGMPSEVNAFYADGRNIYLNQMDGVINNVADLVVGELNRAKARIEAGRQDIAKYVSGLSPELQKVGQEAQQDIQGKFDQLDQDVDAKEDALVNELAQKYVAARGSVDERINAMKDANKGLVSKAAEVLGSVIQTINNLKNMLLGVLARAAGVIDKIISNPIGFLGNLINAVGSGLHKFVGNIGTHLKNGLMGWLFGALGQAGIQIPESLDLKGILSLVMQVLGLTYQNIRARAVAIVGEKTMGLIERSVDVFKKMVTEGPMALWHLIQDKLTDLKDTVLGGIMDFVKDKIIQAGISWVLGLLTPAGAFIKACQAIYNIIMFFVERGSQVMELVNAIINSVGAIASGAIGQAADLVETALGKALPVTISFLADLIGLGGIGEKIRKIIQKVQSPINKAIDAVVKGVAKPFKAIANSKLVTGLKNKVKQGVDWTKDKVQQGVDWTKNKVQQGVDWTKNKVKQGVDWTKNKVQQGKDRLQGKSNKPDERTLEQKQQSLDAAMNAAGAVMDEYQGKRVNKSTLSKLLAPIQKQFGLKTLEPVQDGKNWDVFGQVNPSATRRTSAVAGPTKEELEAAKKQVQAELDKVAADKVTRGDIVRYVKQWQKTYRFALLSLEHDKTKWVIKDKDADDNAITALGDVATAPMEGTKDKPLNIVWPKPASANYPVIYFGGKVPKTMTPKYKTQAEMKALLGQEFGGETVKEYRPHSPSTLPSGEMIGIGSEYRTTTGSIVGPLSTDGTPGGDKLSDVISPYGFKSTADPSNKLELDHVREIQFGGEGKNDVLPNLWPLDKKNNGTGGSTLKSASVERNGAEVAISDLKDEVRSDPAREFWFKITGFVNT